MGIPQHVIELRDLAVIAVELTALGLRLQDLARKELAVDALHRRNLHSLPEVTGTGQLGHVAGLDGLLPAIARRADVADVVTSSQQACLRRIEAGKADAEDA